MSEALKQVTTEFLASRPKLMSFIYGLVRDPHAAEDIYQEVWLKLANAMENGQIGKSHFHRPGRHRVE